MTDLEQMNNNLIIGEFIAARYSGELATELQYLFQELKLTDEQIKRLDFI